MYHCRHCEHSEEATEQDYDRGEKWLVYRNDLMAERKCVRPTPHSSLGNPGLSERRSVAQGDGRRDAGPSDGSDARVFLATFAVEKSAADACPSLVRSSLVPTVRLRVSLSEHCSGDWLAGGHGEAVFLWVSGDVERRPAVDVGESPQPRPVQTTPLESAFLSAYPVDPLTCLQP